MRKSSWVILSIVVVLAGVLAYHKLSAPLPPDEDQIRALLATGGAAVERRSIKATMSCVSKEYSDPAGFKRDGLQLQVIQAFRSADGFDVAVQTREIRTNGDTADVRAWVMLAALRGDERDEVFSGPVIFRLQRESAKRYLVFPTRVWKVAGMSGLPMNPAAQ